ncbi:DUF6350 family protein [Agromyces endophyticus]|uniref:cell division protein PerM n=1 Tax=Agromyces sp. H17E-10 TaxID=2932244 RepID=UPI001FD32C5A|nr:DUF6350 family protein [Agromyces sp. H17E-10]UOQ88331.1 DUF6350 family protein [Agromyces sp. H17E-10]
MSRTTIALLSALEAAVAALIGIGVALVPLLIVWAVHYGLAVDVSVFFRAAADGWLLGHGVDLVARLDDVTAARIGLPGAGDPFPITIALLGFALLTVVAGRRIGRRSAAGGHSITGAASAVVVTAAIGTVVGLAASTGAARVSFWQSLLLPAFVMAIGVVLGAVLETLREADNGDLAGGWVRERVADLPADLVAAARQATRIGAGTAFAVLAVAGVVVAVLIALDYATIAGLSQALGSGVDGGLLLFVGELAFLPNFVIWVASWMLGPGFAIGAGTTIAPGGTVVGQIPGLPLLGALPAEAPVLGVLWLLVPVVSGFAGAWLVLRADPLAARREPWWRGVAVGAGAALVAAAVLGLLAWWSGGAVGPGRLAVVGPDGWSVALVAAATVGIGAIVGAVTARMQQPSSAEAPAATTSRLDLGR